MVSKKPIAQKRLLFFLISVSILFFSFAFNGFGTLSKDFFLYNYKDSESLVVNQISCGGKLFGGQLLDTMNGYNGLSYTCDTSKLLAYSSQYGAQGKVYLLIFKIFEKYINNSIRMFVAFAQLGTALLSSVVLSLFGLWVLQKFNTRTAFITVVLMALSPMLVGFSRNLYWAMPLLFLPLIYTLFLFEKYSKTPKNKILFLVGLFFILYFKYLSGYEYVTTITIMVCSASSYYLYIKKASFVQHSIYYMLVVAVSFMAFTAAVGTHIHSLKTQTGSYKGSARIVLDRAIERSVGSDEYLQYSYEGMKNMENGIFVIADSYVNFDVLKSKKSYLLASFISLTSYLLLPVINIPITINQPFAIYSQSLLVFLIILVIIFIKRKTIFPTKIIRRIGALYTATILGLAGYFSWLIAAHSHSMVHLHINGILMYMPMALFAFVIISVLLDEIIPRSIIRK